MRRFYKWERSSLLMATAKNKQVSFEDALQNLEEIVSELENGEISLDMLMDKYKQGVLLSNLCIEKLDNAETAIDKLLQESKGKIKAVDFDIKEDGADV